MKAVVIHAARDLRVEEREPEPPGPGQIEVAIEAGGNCGSDLHYFNHGGFGTVRLREPMILHEIAGTIRATGADVAKFTVGDRVAISPSRPCNACEYCLRGQQNHCLTCASMAAPCRCRIFRGRSGSVLSLKNGSATRSATASRSTRRPLPSRSL